MKNILSNETYLNDLLRAVDSCDFLDRLDGKTVFITGASGLICSCLVDLLIVYNEKRGGNATLILAGRDPEALEKRFECADRPYISCVHYDAAEAFQLDADVDYIIHGAGNAYPKRIINMPVETIMGSIFGIYNLLQAVRDRLHTRILLISSSEVYGNKTDDMPFKEEEHGYININHARSSYPIGKIAAETICASASAEYGIDSVIVRPGHIYGPTASLHDNRVSSAFAYESAKGNPIIMKSRGEQKRSYCYCVDCASAILTVLVKGRPDTAYNIGCDLETVSICEMAHILADAGHVEIKTELPDEGEKKGFNPMSQSCVDTSRLKQLGWNCLFPPAEGLQHTVQIIKELME